MDLKKALIVSTLTTVLAGCNSGSKSTEAPPPVAPEQPDPLQVMIEEKGITANPTANRVIPSIEDPLPQLGKKLFFTKALSGDLDTACVTCHHPFMGGGDNLSLPVGVHAVDPNLLGPGRLHSEHSFGFDGGPTVPRNAPTTFNTALWDKTFFHDGRIESSSAVAGENGGGNIRTPDTPFGVDDPAAITLPQAQARFPVTSAEEMRAEFQKGESNQVVRDALMARLISQEIPNTWLDEFRAAFNSNADADTLMVYQNVAIAIGEYERSQTFVNTPWKAYLDGNNNAISRKAKNGALLFYRTIEEGGANCASCHSGDFFTDESFHAVAMPQVGRGKGDGTTGDDDFGRFRETKAEADRYAFRTPSLINVEVTGPYTHAGAYTSLEDVVRHHLNPQEAIASYDFTGASLDPGMQVENAQANTEAALTVVSAQQAAGTTHLTNVELTNTQISDLVEFLKALTDPCVKDRECLKQWIPDESDSDPDGLRLHATTEL